MALSCGIVGLPNVGKSTLFNGLLRAKKAAAENYPFCTVDPNLGVVVVPDCRLQKISDLAASEKVVQTTIEFVDIAGLVKGASKGEGLGNQFLSHIREVDAIVHVVRCFQDENVIHVQGNPDPKRDIETINTELCLADLNTCERRLSKVEKVAKSGDKEGRVQLDVLKRALDLLNQGKSIRLGNWSQDELLMIRESHFLTDKPVIFCANCSEEDLHRLDSNSLILQVQEVAQEEDARVICVSGKLEEQLSILSPDEAKDYLEASGLKESGLDQLIRATYDLLNLRTFFTAGPKESKAWTITAGMKAPQAAGRIHTDFEKGFIKAEVISYRDFIECGGWQGARERGVLRIEGKTYEVQDGDVMLFRFNV